MIPQGPGISCFSAPQLVCPLDKTPAELTKPSPSPLPPLYLVWIDQPGLNPGTLGNTPPHQPYSAAAPTPPAPSHDHLPREGAVEARGPVRDSLPHFTCSCRWKPHQANGIPTKSQHSASQHRVVPEAVC